MGLRDDYPDDLRLAVNKGFRGLGPAAEERFAKAIRLGITDPEDPRVASEVIGRFAGSAGAAMLLGATRIRIRLAQEGRYPECYWLGD